MDAHARLKASLETIHSGVSMFKRTGFNDIIDAFLDMGDVGPFPDEKDKIALKHTLIQLMSLVDYSYRAWSFHTDVLPANEKQWQ